VTIRREWGGEETDQRIIEHGDLWLSQIRTSGRELWSDR
jgi:hypothetical protein